MRRVPGSRAGDRLTGFDGVLAAPLEDPGRPVLVVLALLVLFDDVVLLFVFLVAAEHRQRVDVTPGGRGSEQARDQAGRARRPPDRAYRQRETGHADRVEDDLDARLLLILGPGAVARR